MCVSSRPPIGVSRVAVLYWASLTLTIGYSGQSYLMLKDRSTILLSLPKMAAANLGWDSLRSSQVKEACLLGEGPSKTEEAKV
jgi:hypothetical protein